MSKNWSKAKVSSGAFKEYSVPVNTASKRVPSGTGYGPSMGGKKKGGRY